MVRRVFLFPGRARGGPAGLRRALANGGEEAARILAEAADAIGRDPQRDDQLATFLAAHLQLVALRSGEEWSVGAGVGEYNHLVHIGALAFSDAVRLVDARARAFERGPEGAMLSVVGLSATALRAVLAEVAGYAEISRYDGPAQHVIAGERACVRSLKLKLDRIAQCVLSPVRHAVHCDLFEPVADAFEPALWKVRWQRPRQPYLPNVRGEPIEGAGTLDFIASLRSQIHRPVRWWQSLRWIARALPDAVLVPVDAVSSLPVPSFAAIPGG